MGASASRDSPGITACLIVRDEHDSLPHCLSSVAAFVDEIVVCDTGSSDDTPDIARQAGARVITAAWSDDFAAARNTALAACRTDWVLSVDADETVQGTAHSFPLMLALAAREVDALSIQISNASGPDRRGLATHRELKVFRRDRVRWTGRVHERLTKRIGGDVSMARVEAETLNLVHYGYDEQVRTASKAARNARLARLEVDDLRAAGAPNYDLSVAELAAGRSYFGCGHPELASAALQRARALAPEGDSWCWATDFLVRIALAADRLDDAEKLVNQLIEAQAPSSYCHWLLSHVRAQRGDLAGAYLLLSDIERLTDLGGNELDVGQVRRAQRECEVRMATGT
ncbi:glycosyltransferase [Jatrophihabitans sp. DSM 45814]